MNSRGAELTSAFKRGIAIWMVAMLVLGSLPVGSVAAQRSTDTSYTTADGLNTVTWTEGWTPEIDDSDQFSTMVMLNSQITVYTVMFIHDPMAGISTRAVYISLADVLLAGFSNGETVASVEWEDENGGYQGGYLITLSGIDFLLYMRVDPAVHDGQGPTVQLVAAPSVAFPTVLEGLQNEVHINGESAMDGKNGEEIAARVQQNASQPDASESEDAAAAPARSDSDGVSAESDRPSERGKSSVLDRISQPGSTGDEAAPAEAGTYENVSPPYTVAYPDSWLDMSSSNATVGQFSVQLDSGTSAIVSFTGRTTTETNRDAYFDDLIARESRLPGFIGAVKSDDRLLTATFTSDTELTVLEYIFVDDTTVVTVMVTITSPRPENIIPRVQEITLNDDPLLPAWDELWANREGS